MSSIAAEVNPHEGYFHVIMARFDQLEDKFGPLIRKVIDEVENENKPKDLPLDEFFSGFCALKGLDETYPTARTHKSRQNYPKIRNLNELKPIMVSKFVRYLKARLVYVKKCMFSTRMETRLTSFQRSRMTK